MLGNHDAWTCLTRKRLKESWCRNSEDNGNDPAALVRQQIELNGERNLAWNCKELKNKPVSVIGARPFSKVLYFRAIGVLGKETSAGDSGREARWVVPAGWYELGCGRRVLLQLVSMPIL
jgi:hypothetical protein